MGLLITMNRASSESDGVPAVACRNTVDLTWRFERSAPETSS